MNESVSVYEQVGGEATFATIARVFYAGVREDSILESMYPAHDWAGAEERLKLFLMQYWGGPGTYSEQRGHPRLRMRHQPFHINHAARERWLQHMRRALDAANLAPLHDELMWDYFERAALAMVNTYEPAMPGSTA